MHDTALDDEIAPEEPLEAKYESFYNIDSFDTAEMDDYDPAASSVPASVPTSQRFPRALRIKGFLSFEGLPAEITFLVDTGASSNFISLPLAIFLIEHKHAREIVPIRVLIYTGNGMIRGPLRRIEAELSFVGSTQVKVEIFTILPTLTRNEAILGADFLCATAAVIQFPELNLTLREHFYSDQLDRPQESLQLTSVSPEAHKENMYLDFIFRLCRGEIDGTCASSSVTFSDSGRIEILGRDGQPIFSPLDEFDDVPAPSLVQKLPRLPAPAEHLLLRRHLS